MHKGNQIVKKGHFPFFELQSSFLKIWIDYTQGVKKGNFPFLVTIILMKIWIDLTIPTLAISFMQYEKKFFKGFCSWRDEI